MMLLSESGLNSLIESAQKRKCLTRKQHCLGCSKTLAVEITNKLGKRGEYWVVKEAIRFPYETDFLYKKEVWFGNRMKCPNCGRTGKLPMDKPLAAEEIAKPKEVKDASTKSIHQARQVQFVS